MSTLVDTAIAPVSEPGQITCPDCGLNFKGPHLLTAHRSRVHPDSAAKPIAPLKPNGLQR